MPRTPIPVRDGKPLYVNDASGETYTEKPEELTHLAGNRLVPKTSPRIAFRGKLDSLMAEIILLQTEVKALDAAFADDLEEVLRFTRAILGAEVKEEALPEIRLFGMDSEEIRHASHFIKETTGIDHPVPDMSMGHVAARMNHLRCTIREAELSAAAAFDENGTCTRKDLVEALNRLSSAVYVLFCRWVAGRQPSREAGGIRIPVETSARHVHLSKGDLEALFGKGYALTPVRDLSQPGQFLAEEKVALIGPRDTFAKVSILGPVRDETQVEISSSDARRLGIKAPVNLSGNLSGAGDVIIKSATGEISAKGSVIIAKEHVHMTPADAKAYGVSDKEHVAIRIETERPVTLNDVLVRVSDTAGLAVHIDTDQAAAAEAPMRCEGVLLRKGSLAKTGPEETNVKSVRRNGTEKKVMNREELSRLVETVANEVLRARGAAGGSDPAAGDSLAKRVLFVCEGSCALPEEFSRDAQVLGISDYEAHNDISRYDCVVIGKLDTLHLADIALGRPSDKICCAVLSALLEGVEVYILDCTLPHKESAGKGSVALYNTLEGYANTLQRFGIKKYVNREVKAVEIGNAPAHVNPPILIPDAGRAPGTRRGLITEPEALKMAAEFRANGTQSIRLPKGTILTPSARDVFLRNRIEVMV